MQVAVTAVQSVVASAAESAVVLAAVVSVDAFLVLVVADSFHHLAVCFSLAELQQVSQQSLTLALTINQMSIHAH